MALGKERRLPGRIVRDQTRIVERAAREIEQILQRHHGLTQDARAEVRHVMDRHLGTLEYFVLVREDSFGEIHTNHLREGIFFKDPVGMKCAQVTGTTAFYYPRNTGEQLIDVSTPVRLDGAKVFALRSGHILHGVSRHVKFGIPFVVLQLIAIAACLLSGRGLYAYICVAAVVVGTAVVLVDRVAFARAYQTWIAFLRKIGKGDLEFRLSPRSRDEFGQLQFELNKMGLGVRDVIGQVEKSTHQVASAAEQLTVSAEQTTKAIEQIAMAVQEVSVGSTQQAADIETSAQAMNQMTAEIERIADSARSASTKSAANAGAAQEGNQRIETAIQQVTSISSTVGTLSEAVTGLGQRSAQIAGIVDVITDIASQTNLLALNASIEAARAGESGRGFAVVADKVRSLAEQSADSAKTIAALVKSIRQETDDIVRATQATSTEVAAGLQDIHLAGAAFGGIRDAVTEVVAEIQSISRAIQQLSDSSESFKTSIDSIAKVAGATRSEATQVSGVTEEQIVAMQEIASSASVLSGMSNDLQELISRFHM